MLLNQHALLQQQNQHVIMLQANPLINVPGTMVNVEIKDVKIFPLLLMQNAKLQLLKLNALLA